MDVDDIRPARGTVRAFLAADVVAIAVFVLAGATRHETAASGLMHLLNVAVPFYLGWAVTAPLLGGYAASTRAGPLRLALHTLVPWTVAAALAVALRSLPAFHGNAALTLFAVTAGTGGALLLAGRALALTVRQQF